MVHTVYVEMKNKHNTMNSASAGKTYIKMQSQLLSDDDCACFLVEAIAQQSQNIKWETTVDGKKVSHKRIRRVSLDQFYALVTGEEDAFYQMCMVLPVVIQKVVDSGEDVKVPHDTVIQELRTFSNHYPYLLFWHRYRYASKNSHLYSLLLLRDVKTHYMY